MDPAGTPLSPYPTYALLVRKRVVQCGGMHWIVYLSVILSVACTREQPPSDNTAKPGASRPAKPTPTPTPTPKPIPNKVFHEPVMSHLLLVRHASTEAASEFLGVQLGNPLVLGSPYSLPAIQSGPRKGYYRAVASVTGAVGVHALKTERGWQLQRRSLDGSESAPTITLGVEKLTTLMAVGPTVVVGAGEQVGVVDLEAKKPQFRKLVQRRTGGYKAYDVLARDGALIAAIDDIVVPIWAELLSLDDGGSHLMTWEMPSFVNGSYRHAELIVTNAAKRDASLFALGSYGVMDGNGQDLVRLEIRGGKLQTSSEVILNATPLRDPPVLEEHVSRQTNKPEKLTAGTKMTAWTGMAIARTNATPTHVLLAAGTRGLLVVPATFDPSTKATAVDLGGTVHDVISAGAVFYALVETREGTGRLTSLRRTKTGVSVVTTTDLPKVFRRFAR